MTLAVFIRWYQRLITMNQFRVCLNLVAVATFLCQPILTDAAPSAVDIDGTWEINWVHFDVINVNRIEFKTSGEQISGKGFWNATMEGNRVGDKLDVKLLNPGKKLVATLQGTIKSDCLSGKVRID